MKRFIRSFGGGALGFFRSFLKHSTPYKVEKTCYNSDILLHNCKERFNSCANVQYLNETLLLPSKKKTAFTLAEVLITLGIIGVVAAITIPSLIQKYNEKVWVTSYLRVYSILENAYKSAVENNGTFEQWSGATITTDEHGTKIRTNAKSENVYDVMIKPYVTISNIQFQVKNHSNCMPDKSFHLDGSKETIALHATKYTALLPSGECVNIAWTTLADFYVDLNGKRKPNTLGKDQFVFSFDVDNPNRIKPGYNQMYWTDTPAYCDKNSAHGWIAGISCGFWILRNHNMDYLHLPYEDIVKKWGGSGW